MKDFCARVTPWGTIQTGDQFGRLPAFEQQAILAHERGHLHHKHVRRRLLWFFTLRAFFQTEKFFAMCEAQELEADQYAKTCGYGPGLIAYLLVHAHDGRPSISKRLRALHV